MNDCTWIEKKLQNVIPKLWDHSDCNDVSQAGDEFRNSFDSLLVTIVNDLGCNSAAIYRYNQVLGWFFNIGKFVKCTDDVDLDKGIHDTYIRDFTHPPEEWLKHFKSNTSGVLACCNMCLKDSGTCLNKCFNTIARNVMHKRFIIVPLKVGVFVEGFAIFYGFNDDLNYSGERSSKNKFSVLLQSAIFRNFIINNAHYYESTDWLTVANSHNSLPLILHDINNPLTIFQYAIDKLRDKLTEKNLLDAEFEDLFQRKETALNKIIYNVELLQNYFVYNTEQLGVFNLKSLIEESMTIVQRDFSRDNIKIIDSYSGASAFDLDCNKTIVIHIFLYILRMYKKFFQVNCELENYLNSPHCLDLEILFVATNQSTPNYSNQQNNNIGIGPIAQLMFISDIDITKTYEKLVSLPLDNSKQTVSVYDKKSIVLGVNWKILREHVSSNLGKLFLKVLRNKKTAIIIEFHGLREKTSKIN